MFKSVKGSGKIAAQHLEHLPLYLSTAFKLNPVNTEHIISITIQQIVTLSKYGHDALDICHP